MRKKLLSVLFCAMLILVNTNTCIAAEQGTKNEIIDIDDTLLEDVIVEEIEENVQPQGNGYYSWSLSKKLVNKEYKGSYKTVGSATVLAKDAPQDITVTGSRTYTHQVSGTVMVSKKTLESCVGFSYSYSKTQGLSITKRNASAGTYLGQSRGVYKRYKITQQRYYHLDGTKTKYGDPHYCYVNVYQYDDQRLTKK